MPGASIQVCIFSKQPSEIAGDLEFHKISRSNTIYHSLKN